MLGEFPSVSRSDLLKVRATGIESEVSWFLQKIFDDGHRFEALARPLAEKIVGEDLYPCVGVEGKLSASFDGLTMPGDMVFEHKTLNAILRDCMVDGCTGADLPIYHQIQMEQQLMVSGAERALFMASEWDEDGNLIEERHCWYTSTPKLRERIIAGWDQFERDVCAYEDKPIAAPVVGRAPQTLPSLNIQVSGMVTASNLAEFRGEAMSVLQRINRNLQTDEDFADAEQTVKWCKGVEDRIDTTKQQVLGQTADIDAVFRTLDEVSGEARKIRLELDRLVKVEKENRRGQIVAAGVQAVRDHYAAINASLGAHALAVPATLPADIGAAIKGKKSLSSMQDAVSTTAANAKIAASQQADRVRACIHVLEMEMGDYGVLFPDRVQLCASKSPEDLRNLATARIAEHQKREHDRLEAERAKIRAEEEARALHMQQEAETARRAAEAHEQKQATHVPAAPAPTPSPALAYSAPAADAPQRRMKLGEIKSAIAPMSITAEGLAELGFLPVGTDRAAQLYDATRFPAMVAAMQRRLAMSLDKAAA
ncbi:hypothetical protein [Xanthomonas albilineans]|uniref:hypothetical protein n=1 Tax=Xanthomonas albilineans TaxID=29447 RepID=UPI001E4ACA1C|nr:hypothetical protein [Xanthomonas albilineans]